MAATARAMSPPLRARELIEEGTRRALSEKLKAVEPYDPGRPCEIRVEITTDRVEEFAQGPASRSRSRSPWSRADDWWTAWSRLYF